MSKPILIKKKFQMEREDIQKELMQEIDPLIARGKGEEALRFKPEPILSVVTNAPFEDKRVEQEFLKSPQAKQDIFVLILEGVHGIGKTTLLKQFKYAGFNIINEHFLNTFSNFILPPDSEKKVDHNCAVEFAWAGQQMINIVNLATNLRRKIYRRKCLDLPRRPYDDVIVVDRCYLTGAAYGHFSESFDNFLKVFRGAFAQIEETHNIHPIYTYLKCDDLMKVFKHINQRIDGAKVHLSEEEAKKRQQLKEQDLKFLKEKHDRYERFNKDGIFNIIVYQDYDDTTIYKVIRAYKYYRHRYYMNLMNDDSINNNDSDDNEDSFLTSSSLTFYNSDSDSNTDE